MIRIIYIHGFLSSPNSFKARATQEWLLSLSTPGTNLTTPLISERFARLDIEFLCPKLSSYPREALEQLIALCDCGDHEQTFLIGSSLGGFWASYLVEEQRAKRAVLINPAVSPHQRFAEFVGTELKSYYSDEVYRLEQADIDKLSLCEPSEVRDPSRYWLMVQAGDEVLDYKDAVRRYDHCKKTVEEGGNHSFEGYTEHLPDILDFLIGDNPG